MMSGRSHGPVRTLNVGSSSNFWMAELVRSSFGLGLDGDLMTGSGELHRLQNNLIVGIAQSVSGGGVLKADHRVDVARPTPSDRGSPVGVHLEEL